MPICLYTRKDGVGIAEKQGTPDRSGGRALLSVLPLPERVKMGITYSESTNDSRWLILNDLEQDFPEEDFEIENSEERQTANGKTMPVLTLKGVDTGATVQVCAWKRDVSKCVKQYGANVDQWDLVGFEKNKNRYELVPRGMAVTVERVK